MKILGLGCLLVLLGSLEIVRESVNSIESSKLMSCLVPTLRPAMVVISPLMKGRLGCSG